MAKLEKHIPSDFQKLYDSLSLTEKLTVDSAVKMNFLLFQQMHEMIVNMQQNQNRKD